MSLADPRSVRWSQVWCAVLMAAAVAFAGCLDPFPAGTPLVTFVIDDGNVTDFTIKKPVFDAHGAVAVSAIISGRRVLTDSQLLAMQAAGWEIASHSRTHLDETRLTGSALADEIGGAKRDLERIGLNVTTHGYPYGQVTPNVAGIGRTYYKAGVASGGGFNP